MTVWSFDVGLTDHDLLHEGITVREYVGVCIEAPSWVEASCLAIQIVGCHGYVTECLDRI